MELNREHFRAMIFYDFKVGLEPSGCHERLQTAFGDSAPSLATVYNWFREFRSSRNSLADEARSGRPATAVTPENVTAAEKLIRANRRIKYEELEEELGIGSAAVSSILHDHLKVRKVTACWVPHSLTEAQKQARVDWCKEMLEKFDYGRSKLVSEVVTGDETWLYHFDPETKRQSTSWVFEGSPRPQKVRRPRSVGKKMVAVFFSKSGLVKVVPLEEQKTVTSLWYTTVCLPKVFEELKKRRPKTGLRGILLHQDNASSHTAGRTSQFLSEQTVKLLTHPPYSPDLAPCDFFLFPKVKEGLKGVKFSGDDDALDALDSELARLTSEDYKECFNSWFYRMERCIAVGGDYFEGM
jgi:histone-lysine N-methyltransferase SETMAR